MTEVEFLRRELERQLKAVDDLNKMIKDLSQITFESKMDKWLKASKTKDEPVAWMSEDEHTVYTSKQVDGCFQHDHIPLYTTPQQGCAECGNGGGYALYCLVCSEKFVGNKEWVGLTEYDIKGVLGLNESWVGEDCSIPDMIGFAKAIEAKLKDKNHVVSGQ